MVFLHSHGVGTARAVRIFKTYGSDAVVAHSTLVFSQSPIPPCGVLAARAERIVTPARSCFPNYHPRRIPATSPKASLPRADIVFGRRRRSSWRDLSAEDGTDPRPECRSKNCLPVRFVRPRKVIP
jgi:hypothetical protein